VFPHIPQAFRFRAKLLNVKIQTQRVRFYFPRRT
jgi:hypothetical protein